jgi:hypothetical protein
MGVEADEDWEMGSWGLGEVVSCMGLYNSVV